MSCFSLFGQIGFSKQISNSPNFSNPDELIPVDLDNDGDKDLIGYGLTSTLVFYENTSKETVTFSDPVTITTFNWFNYGSLVVVDYDADGLQDVLYIIDNVITFVKNTSKSRISFQTENIPLELPNGARDLRVVDLNNDGILDLVLKNSTFNELIWFESISFGQYHDFQLLVDDQVRDDYEFGDIDNDGDLDLICMVVQNNNTTTLTYFQNAAGSFTEAAEIKTGIGSIEDVEIVEIDNDNNKDVVLLIGSIWDQSLKWFENPGFGQNWTEHTIAENVDQIRIGIGNIDVNNSNDIVSTNNDTLGYYKNDFFGNFSWESMDFPLIDEIGSISIADFNKDGSNEIVSITADNWSNVDQALIFSSSGNGTFHDPVELVDDDGVITPWAENLNTFTSAMVAKDINEDGLLELVTLHQSYNKIAYRTFQNQKQPFTRSTIVASPSNFSPYEFIRYADLNGDGHEDIIAVVGGTVYWLEKMGPHPEYGAAKLIGGVNGIKNVVPVDFDFDGDMDIVGLKSGNSMEWFENLDGLGSFGSEVQISLNTWDGDNLHLSDIDADNDYDIIVLQDDENNVRWYENSGNNYQDLATLASGTFSAASQLQDINQDGLDDLIYVNDNGLLTGHLNLGAGNIGPATILAEGLFLSNTTVITFLDHNNDGLLDIFALSEDNFVAYLEYTGQGIEFQPVEVFTELPFNTTNICVADFTNDGQTDIVAYVEEQQATYFSQNFELEPKITAKIFMDLNQNGIQDGDEYILFGQNFQLNPTEIGSFPNLSGITTFAVTSGSYEVSANPVNYCEFTTADAFSFEITDNANTTNLCFGVHPIVDLLSGNLEMTSAPTRCNTEVPFWINYSNDGTLPATVSVSYHDHPLATFVSSNPVPSGIIGDSIFWNFDELLPFEGGIIELTLQIADENSVDELISIAPKITLNASDSGETFYRYNGYRSWIVCAVDPNDKLVEPNIPNQQNYTLFGDTLDYTVRFQNTGNDVAINVRIEDILDENLNWNTLEMIGASHDFRAELDMNTGRLLFHFDDIYLPDSTSNYVESQGFVRFKIQHKEGLKERTYIENHAGIYFDLNEPVITNSVENILVTSELGAIVEIPDCSNSNFGSISIVSDTSYFQSVLWSNGQTGSEIGGLELGTYFVDVLLYNGELLSDTFLIDSPIPFTIESSITAETNNDANGSATITILDGIQPFTYQWEHDPDETTNMADNLSAGEYNVTITDGNNCDEEFTVTVENTIVSTENEFKNIGFNISPNPSKGAININLEFEESQNWQLNIFNTLGQNIRQVNALVGSPNNSNISIELNSGIYFIALQINGNFVGTKTVVINN